MSPLSRALAGVLAVQLVLVAILWWPQDPDARTRAIVPFEVDAIARVSIGRRPIGEAELEPIVLARGEDGWVVESAAGYPADPEKVTVLLEALTGLRSGAPIVTQQTSWDALGVSEDNYGRRVEIGAGDETLKLVLGAATSKSVHLRIEGEPEVFLATGTSEWAIRDSNAAYYDAVYVEASLDDLTGITLHNEHGVLSFTREGDDWTLAELSEGEVANRDEVAALLGKLLRVRMSEPVASQVEEAHGLDGSLGVAWTIAAEDQSRVGGYEVGTESGADRYLKAIDSGWVVKARAGGFDALRQARREDLLDEPTPEGLSE